MAKIIYHSNCNDGSGAALAAWTKLKDEGSQYIPVQYGDDPPAIEDGDTVYILDFSFPLKAMIEIARKAERMVVIDHHKSAGDQLLLLAKEFGLPTSGDYTAWEAESSDKKMKIIFDVEHSAAPLAWQHFHPGEWIPELIRYVEDRDIWKHKMGPRTEWLSKALPTLGDFRKWEPLLSDCTLLDERGQGIQAFMAAEVEKIIKTVSTCRVFWYENVPIINCPGFLISDALHTILQREDPENKSPFAIAYFDIPSKEKRIFSLRSTDDRDDVSVVAGWFGGGGHRNAAGFRLNHKTEITT